MRRVSVLVLLASIIGLGAVNHASAGVVTFDNSVGNDIVNNSVNYGPGQAFTDQGLTFTNSGTQNMTVFGDIAGGTGNGTNGLAFSFYSTDLMTMTLSGGGNFNVTSIDFDTTFLAGSANDTITINGKPLNITDDMTTYVLNLTNVSQVVISGLPNEGYWQADNIVFSASATPLPATFPLFAGGLGLVGFFGSRGKRKAKKETLV